MNTQLYCIKCYYSCLFFSFLAQNCSGFTIEILIIVIKMLSCFRSFSYLSLCHDDVVYVMIEIFQKIQFISLFLFDDWHHQSSKNSLPQCAIQNSPNIFLKEHLFTSCCIQFLKWNALSLYFYSKNSFSKNIHYVIHVVFKNEITYFLLKHLSCF